MSGADFLDSSVFVHLFDEIDSGKHATARQVVSEALNRDSGVIGFQVVQETLDVITTRLPVVVEPDDACVFLRETLQPLWRVPPGAALDERAVALQGRPGYGFCDSLIVAAALEAGCKRLLSEDLQHGQRIDGLRIQNPFKE